LSGKRGGEGGEGEKKNRKAEYPIGPTRGEKERTFFMEGRYIVRGNGGVSISVKKKSALKGEKKGKGGIFSRAH